MYLDGWEKIGDKMLPAAQRAAIVPLTFVTGVKRIECQVVVLAQDGTTQISNQDTFHAINASRSWGDDYLPSTIASSRLPRTPGGGGGGDPEPRWARGIKRDSVTSLGVASPGVLLDLQLLTTMLKQALAAMMSKGTSASYNIVTRRRVGRPSLQKARRPQLEPAKAGIWQDLAQLKKDAGLWNSELVSGDLTAPSFGPRR
ncbi:hypothetical protein C8A01DRAFT_39216 [Parachaetomium inaequale]|uniref:Uncharacterized protein n=1 Tax=Parachaetomium inaequale TaxID=2588326 RepID=A0AAN6SP15_9PEZI|nr:hypothetical protein C8A01DRAFT_39216 [Parachaetomium inaequale]